MKKGVNKSKKNKVGRNDPCVCGSGKKYKKCCINKMQEKPISQDLPTSNNSEDRFNYNQGFQDLYKRYILNNPTSKQKRQNNHYVPVGYQKRFILDRQKKLYYLDLNPKYKELPDGRRVRISRDLRYQGPKICFFEKDLYTTKFFNIRNEEIETYLFGKIDDNIHDALDGLILNNHRLLHKYFQYIFEYIDAQKLRTPKGLDWIKSNYFQLTKNELLLEMQFLRTMHCTMWVEGIMEIVSAEDSNIKFIISDHPVTIYNYACSPDSDFCKYSNDPPTAWKASQTIFPLGLNHCLILTNLEYGDSPDEVDPVSGRTNPRFFSQTITRWDTIIRDRKLKEEEVCAINYIIKRRARKYIAAGKKEWLYPEKMYTKNEWKSLRKIFLPPKNKIHQFGGEIYAGGKDGSLAWYQDAFGRRHTSREDENNPIRKYSISKRNEILNNAIWKIFGFNKGKSWDDFRKELSNEKIKELYRVVGMLWNPDTELTNLLPKPQNDKLRAFYHGSLDPRITPLTVIGYSLYVDEIIMYSPFFNPRAINKDYSPYEKPHLYIEDTIKNILMIIDLMPLIDCNIVEMIPDPCEFAPELRMRTFRMAESRMKYKNTNEKEMYYTYKLMQEDAKRSFLSLPSEILINKLKKSSPNISNEEIENTLAFIEEQRLADPLSPTQSPNINNEGRLHIFRMSGTHEMALYLAQITGSFVYTDVKHCWNEYNQSELKKPKEEVANFWGPLVRALNDFNLIMYIDPDPRFWPTIKNKGYFKDFINLHKNILKSVREITNQKKADIKTKEYIKRLKDINLEKIFKKIEIDYKKEFKDSGKMSKKIKIPANYFIPVNGIGSNAVTQILLTHGINTSYWKSVPFGLYLNLNEIKNF